MSVYAVCRWKFRPNYSMKCYFQCNNIFMLAVNIDILIDIFVKCESVFITESLKWFSQEHINCTIMFILINNGIFSNILNILYFIIKNYMFIKIVVDSQVTHWLPFTNPWRLRTSFITGSYTGY